ncbi:hypothetical protein PWW31_12030 [Vibrio harveyi]|nr:hypothetical protein PWW31_12030 [Vibrio harveyi]
MKRTLILLILSISFSAFASPETEKGKALYIALGKVVAPRAMVKPEMSQ